MNDNAILKITENMYQNNGLILFFGFVLGGIVFLIYPFTDYMGYFQQILYGGVAGIIIVWSIGTKSGRALINRIMENRHGRREKAGNSGKDDEVICPECGWVNISKDNYCTDCGTILE